MNAEEQVALIALEFERGRLVGIAEERERRGATAWLIEYEMGTYWGGEDAVVLDVDYAVRFSRKEDAERVCRWDRVQQRGAARVTEHMWLDAPRPR